MSYCGLIDAKIRASDKDLPVYDFIDFTARFISLGAFIYTSVTWIKTLIRSAGWGNFGFNFCVDNRKKINAMELSM